LFLLLKVSLLTLPTGPAPAAHLRICCSVRISTLT